VNGSEATAADSGPMRMLDGPAPASAIV